MSGGFGGFGGVGGGGGGGGSNPFGANGKWGPSSFGGGGTGGGYGAPEPYNAPPMAYAPPMGQINQVTALQRENDALRMQTQALTSKAQNMEHALSMAEAKMRQPNPEFQQRMAEMAREGQRLHEEKEGLRRQLGQLETQGAGVKAQHAGVTAQHDQQVRALKGHEEQLRLQVDQEKRAAADRSELDRVQHQRDLDAARKEKEQIQDECRRRCTELEAQIAKLQLERDRDHEATVEAQRLVREQESRGGKLADEVKRREDLITTHEREAREKQERIDDGLKRTAALQASVVEHEQKAKGTGAELDQKSREVETLRKDNASLMESLKSEQRNCEKWAKGYADVGAILGASEVEIRGINLDGAAAGLSKDLDAQKHSATKLQHELEEKKHAVAAQKLKTTQAERERDDAREAMLTREDQVTVLQEDLLTSTVELRDLLGKQDAMTRDIALETQRRNEYETGLKDKDKEITKMLEAAAKKETEFQKAQAAWLAEKLGLEDASRQHLALLENDHHNAISTFEQSLAAAGADAQDKLEFADMCVTMGTLLEVNTKTSSAMLARTLYDKVTELLNTEVELKADVKKRKADLLDAEHKLKEALNHTIFVHEQPVPTPIVHETIHHHPAPVNEHIHHTHTQGMGFGAGAGAGITLRDSGTMQGRHGYSTSAKSETLKEEIFDELDGDGNEVIDRKEWMKKTSGTRKDKAKVFDELDADGNGVIDRDEWRKGTTATTGGRSLSRGGRKTRDSDAEYRLREEAKVLRSKMATLQLKYDDFVTAISMAIGIKQHLGDKTRTDVLVERVRELMAEGGASLTDSKAGRLGASKGSGSSKNLKQLQRKFRIAIRTIETLDKIIEKLRDGGPSVAGMTLLHKNHELQIELTELKDQLFDQSHSMNLETKGDHTSLEHALGELDRYRRLVDDIMAQLGMRSTIAPDFKAIINKIKELRGAGGGGGGGSRSFASPSSVRRTPTNKRSIRLPFRP